MVKYYGIMSKVGKIRVAPETLTQVRKVVEEEDVKAAKMKVTRKVYTDAVTATVSHWKPLVDAFEVDKDGNFNEAQLNYILKVWNQKGEDPNPRQVKCIFEYFRKLKGDYSSSKNLDKCAELAGGWLVVLDDIPWVEAVMAKYKIANRDGSLERWLFRLLLNDLNGGYEATHDDVDVILKFAGDSGNYGKPIDMEKVRMCITDWMPGAVIYNAEREVENLRLDGIEIRARERAKIPIGGRFAWRAYAPSW